MEQLGADAAVRKELDKENRRLRAQVREWFAPQMDTIEPKDASKWKRGGVGYPELTELATRATHPDLGLRMARGVYGAYCGMTHPNILVLAETLQLPENGSGFVHRAKDVDKEIRTGLFALEHGVLVWSRYFSTETDFNTLRVLLDSISERFEAASSELQ